ncbi:GAF domain-containing protein [Candidatus Gracilibacteria bacterium]|nr:GAF domain-containing protein [Candidatus Gracilibacteria bacterium]
MTSEPQPVAHGEVMLPSTLWPLLLVPLTIKDQHLGVMVLGGLHQPFSVADQLFAEVLAQRVAALLVNRRLYDLERLARAQAERNAERLTRLQRVSDALARAENPVDAAAVVAQQGRALLNAAGAIVTMLHPDRTLEVIAADGYDEAVVNPWRRFSLDANVPLAYAALYNQPIWLGSPEEWRARYQPIIDDSMVDAAWCALPISFGGHVFGSIGMSFAGRRQFVDADRSTLISMVAQCAAAFRCAARARA